MENKATKLLLFMDYERKTYAHA